MNVGKVDYDPAKRLLKDRVRFRVPFHISSLIPRGIKWAYITLGGEQLYDVARLLYGLDRRHYPHEIISVYYDPDEDTDSARQTIKTAELIANEIHVTYKLRSTPRIIYGTVQNLHPTEIMSDMVAMFLDYEGTVDKYRHEIGACVSNGILETGDLLFVTSCVDERFFEGNPSFRAKAQRRVSEYCRKLPDQVTSVDLLKFHDLNLIRDQIRLASFHLKHKVDCKPVGPLVMYENTVRMLWLPMRIIRYDPKSSPPKVKLETLRR